MPWRETHAKFKQLTSLERIKGQTKVPCIIQDIDSRRGLEYQLDVRTGFSNFASSFDPRRPTEWAALEEEAAKGQVAITHTVPRENFNTFFFAMTCVLQVIFNKQWSTLFWQSVEQVGFYNCWYFYSLIGVGNWLLLSISFAIIITTAQRQNVQARLYSQEQENDSGVGAAAVARLRQFYAAVQQGTCLTGFWLRAHANSKASPPSPSDKTAPIPDEESGRGHTRPETASTNDGLLTSQRATAGEAHGIGRTQSADHGPGRTQSALTKAFERALSAQSGVRYDSSDDEDTQEQRERIERAASHVGRTTSTQSLQTDMLLLHGKAKRMDPAQKMAIAVSRLPSKTTHAAAAGASTQVAATETGNKKRRQKKNDRGRSRSESSENGSRHTASSDPASAMPAATPASDAVMIAPLSDFWATQRRLGQSAAGGAPNYAVGPDATLWGDVRQLAGTCVLSRPYQAFKIILLVVNFAGVALERQQIPRAQRDVLQTIYAVTSALFLWDFVLQITGLGLWHYLGSIYNCLDFVALVCSIVDHVWSLSADGTFSAEVGGQFATGASRLAVCRVFRVIGFPRFFVSSISDPASQIMYLAIESAVSKMVPTALLVMAAFSGFSVLGQHLLAGIMHGCSDPTIFERQDCVGQDASGAPRTWDLQGINFGWFGAAMETVWVISASNDWPKIMWRAIDATERDSGPYQNHNLAMALYFFGVASFSLLVLLNLFISVFVCVYLAQSHQQATQLAQGVPQFKTVPKEKPTRPQLPIIKELVITDPFRKKIYDALEAVTAQVVVNVCILGTLVTMLAESYHMDGEQRRVLQALDVFFTFVFGTEVILRLVTLHLGVMVADKWLCFDYLIYVFGVGDLILESAVVGKWMRSARWVRGLRTLRLMRILRSYRLLKGIEGVKRLLVTLRAALPMLLNLIVVLCIVFFCFAALGVKMFGSMCVEGDQLLPGWRATRCLMMQEDDAQRRLDSKLLGEHAHFRHFGWALLSLLKIATVDGMSTTLNQLDTTPLPRLPSAAGAMQAAIDSLRQLPDAETFAERRALVLLARKHLGGCVTARELNQMQDAGVVDCRPVDDDSDVYPSCYTTCGSTWLSQFYFIAFASVTSFVLLNIMVSVLIVALGQAVQVKLSNPSF